MRIILIYFAALLTSAQLSAQEPEREIGRVTAMASIAAKEYAIGVVDGQIVSEAEILEAELFLGEARRAAAQLDAAAGALLTAYVDSMATVVSDRASSDSLTALSGRLHAAVRERLGVSLDPAPENPPSLALGATIYSAQCASCHGTGGAGDGAAGIGLDPPPAVLDDRLALADLSLLDFYRVLRVGVQGTAMPAFEESLSDEERWAVALYASSLRGASVALPAGRDHLQRLCADCYARYALIENSFDVSDDSLRIAIAGLTGHSPDDTAVVAAAQYARIAGAAEQLGGDRTWRVRGVIAGVRDIVRTAALLAGDGAPDAARDSAMSAYFRFESVEGTLRAADPGAVQRLESEFALFRSELGSTPARAERAWQRIDRALEAVSDAAESGWGPRVLFGKSLVIILREGVEAILIVGALTAVLVRAGAPERRRDIGAGVGLALLASVATAIVFGTWMQNAIASQEAVEGFTMLLAAVVLFWVSYWLVSKVEMRRWQEFVRSQITRALQSRSRLALAAVAFLAVYREGFETVLFYAALFSGAQGSGAATAAVTGGMVAGGGLLIVVYWVMQRFGLRIPLKPFFAVTSALLYIMAFSFAGQGVSELQAAGYLPAHPVAWLPSIPWLGIFPTAQTFVIQLFFTAAVGFALLWVFRLSPVARRAPAAD